MVDGKLLLDELAGVYRGWAVLPRFGPVASALFTVHTYAYHLREVTAYLGIESPVKRCGKSTLLSVLSAHYSVHGTLPRIRSSCWAWTSSVPSFQITKSALAIFCSIGHCALIR
jgi:hypothetical protein